MSIAGRGRYSEEAVAAAEQLTAMLARMVEKEGKSATAIEGLFLTRWDNDTRTDTCFYSPGVGLVVQGRKESLIGSELFRYGAMDCLVNGVDMPSVSTITEAAPDKPLFAVSLAIDRAMATELAADIPPASRSVDPFGISVAPAAPDVLDAFVRLVGLLDKPEQIPLRAPLIIREIVTRVLLGPQGASLRRMYTVGSHSNQVVEAVTWLRENYAQPLQVDELAVRVGMAGSTFYRQFKKVTSISPLQYQKYLRLYEAQRLMLAEDLDANSAGRTVGYDSIQQFNREYKRMFGEPPLRDIKRLRGE